MLDNILAKSDPKESLVEHTTNVVVQWQYLKKRYEKVLNQSDDFWSKSYLSALFHDFGKVADNFQDVMHAKKKYDTNYIRHEFLSGMILLAYNISEYQKEPNSLFAVFSHHKPLTDELFREQDSKADIRIDENNLKNLFVWFNQQLKNHHLKELPADLGKNILKQFQKNDDGINFLYYKFTKFFDNFRKNIGINAFHTRKEYILYKALLNIADWTASAHQELPKGLIFTQDFLRDKIVEKLREDGKIQIANKFNFRRFQLESIRQGSVLAIAPTGSGKTEAALLWASQKQEFEKIIYLLPTRVTSNAIYQRLISYFHKSNCAVVHSSAFLFRKNLEDGFSKGDYLKDKTFFKNVSVCTIDQVLTQGFNLGFWEIKTFHLLKAKVIIDEVHLYEPYTLGLLIATIKYLKKEFETEFYIMTATMPKQLQNLLQKTLDISDEGIIKDSELLEQARNTFEVRDALIDELDSEIKSELSQKKKVLLVVNTVDEAIRLYEKYKNSCENVICFHSRFTQKDRLEKEAKILELEKSNEQVLLIATQVVEVSLDIDFDVLFTENAPIDAIIQRAGRVNRKRLKDYSKVVVFKHQSITEEAIYNKENFLSRTFDELKKLHGKKLTEAQLIELVEKVYENYNINEDKYYKKGLEAYQKIQRDNLHFIKDNLGLEESYTREGLDSENIIPDVFQEKLVGASIFEKSRYELAITRKRMLSGKIIKDKEHQWIKYFECDYDEHTGLKFKKKAGNQSTIL
jgi:CRISPR-associated endonuclease/helicase Cas3